MREIILDTETTGLKPAEGHRLVEIGCVEMMQGVRTGRTWHRYLNPERDVPREAERVHGLSTAFLRDKPVFGFIADELLAFLGDDRIVAHNADFDLGFLNAELAGIGRAPLPAGRAVDTAAMARRLFPGQRASLDALCARFGIDTTARSKHGALVDAELLAQVYIELTGGRQTALGLAVVTTEASVAATAVTRPFRVPRVFAPDADERAAHAAFVARLKEPLWNQFDPPADAATNAARPES